MLANYRVQLFNEVVLYTLDILPRNRSPSCPKHSSNGEGRHARVAGQGLEVVTDIATPDQNWPLGIAVMIEKKDAKDRRAGIGSRQYWKPPAVIGHSPLQLHPLLQLQLPAQS
jgi:hypothetical protein